MGAGLFFDSVKEVPSENRRREASPTPPKFTRNQIEDWKLVKEADKPGQTTTPEITGDRRENTSAPTTGATPPVAAADNRTGSATGGLLPSQGVTLAVAAGNDRRYSLEGGGEKRQSAVVCENFRKLVEEKKISEKSEEEFYDSFLSRPSSTFTSSLLVGASSSGVAVHSSSVAQSVVSK